MGGMTMGKILIKLKQKQKTNREEMENEQKKIEYNMKI